METKEDKKKTKKKDINPIILTSKSGKKYFVVNGRNIFIKSTMTKTEIRSIYRLLKKYLPHAKTKTDKDNNKKINKGVKDIFGRAGKRSKRPSSNKAFFNKFRFSRASAPVSKVDNLKEDRENALINQLNKEKEENKRKEQLLLQYDGPPPPLAPPGQPPVELLNYSIPSHKDRLNQAMAEFVESRDILKLPGILSNNERMNYYVQKYSLPENFPTTILEAYQKKSVLKKKSKPPVQSSSEESYYSSDSLPPPKPQTPPPPPKPQTPPPPPKPQTPPQHPPSPKPSILKQFTKFMKKNPPPPPPPKPQQVSQVSPLAQDENSLRNIYPSNVFEYAKPKTPQIIDPRELLSPNTLAAIDEFNAIDRDVFTPSTNEQISRGDYKIERPQYSSSSELSKKSTSHQHTDTDYENYGVPQEFNIQRNPIYQSDSNDSYPEAESPRTRAERREHINDMRRELIRQELQSYYSKPLIARAIEDQPPPEILQPFQKEIERQPYDREAEQQGIKLMLNDAKNKMREQQEQQAQQEKQQLISIPQQEFPTESLSDRLDKLKAEHAPIIKQIEQANELHAQSLRNIREKFRAPANNETQQKLQRQQVEQEQKKAEQEKLDKQAEADRKELQELNKQRERQAEADRLGQIQQEYMKSPPTLIYEPPKQDIDIVSSYLQPLEVNQSIEQPIEDVQIAESYFQSEQPEIIINPNEYKSYNPGAPKKSRFDEYVAAELYKQTKIKSLRGYDKYSSDNFQKIIDKNKNSPEFQEKLKIAYNNAKKRDDKFRETHKYKPKKVKTVVEPVIEPVVEPVVVPRTSYADLYKTMDDEYLNQQLQSVAKTRQHMDAGRDIDLYNKADTIEKKKKRLETLNKLIPLQQDYLTRDMPASTEANIKLDIRQWEIEKELLERAIKKGSGKSDDGGLYDDQLDRIMKKEPDYYGSIMRDEIPMLLPYISKRSRVGFIINLDKSTGPGTHWCAIYIDARPNGSNSLEYFDVCSRIVFLIPIAVTVSMPEPKSILMTSKFFTIG